MDASENLPRELDSRADDDIQVCGQHHHAGPTANSHHRPTPERLTSMTTTTPTTTSTDEALDPVFLLADTDPAAMKATNAALVAGFRATNGRLDGAFEGVPLLLLTATGARSGRPSTTPMNFTRDGEGYVVVASKSGAARHPDWYHNLLVHPEASIEVNDTVVAVRARTTSGAERAKLFARHCTALPNFAAYQRRTTRQLPVLVLEPTG
jgi:deazaflavin-dependent oxidoreductase (nitroreductase family)